MDTRGQAHFNCCLSILLAADWLRAVEGLGACSVVTVLEHVCCRAVWDAVVGWGVCVLNACILGASGM